MFAAALEAGGLGREVALVITDSHAQPTGQQQDTGLKGNSLGGGIASMLASLAPKPKAAPRRFGF